MTANSGPARRLPLLRQRLEEEGLSALLITDLLNVRYITGFTGSAAVALVTPTEVLIFTDSRYFLQAAREAPLFRLVKLEGPRKSAEIIAEAMQALSLQTIGFESTLPYGRYADLQAAIPDVLFQPVKELVEQLRLVKDDVEIAHIRRAVAITDACFEHVLTVLRPGITERDIAVEIECFVRRQGAERESFESIVASGPLAASPHAHATDKVIQGGELVKMDFGALWGGYAADITRTVAVGSADEKQRSVYAVVLEAQKAAMAAIHPGVSGRDVDAVARAVITEHGYGDYFGHGLGHSLGLHVHDGPGLSPSSPVVLEAGMIMTVEPGIYLPGWGGIRIEDDVLVTETGIEVLTHSPKSFMVLEPQ